MQMTWSSAEVFKSLLEKCGETVSKGTIEKLTSLAVKDMPYVSCPSAPKYPVRLDTYHSEFGSTIASIPPSTAHCSQQKVTDIPRPSVKVGL